MDETLMMTGQLLSDSSVAHSAQIAQDIGSIQLLIFLLIAWGLYNINKKLGEPNAWLSWVPILNVYSYVRAAGKTSIWILWLILGFTLGIILFGLPGWILLIILTHNISKRTGGGVGRTLGFIFLGFIFFPLVGYQLKGNTAEAASITPAVETSTVVTPNSESSVVVPVAEGISPIAEVPVLVPEIIAPVTPIAEEVATPPTTISTNNGNTSSQS